MLTIGVAVTTEQSTSCAALVHECTERAAVAREHAGVQGEAARTFASPIDVDD
jgi:hypothetical protein